MMKLQDKPYVYPTKLADVFYGGKVDVEVLGHNIRHIDNYMQLHQQNERDTRIAIDDKFEEMERRISDAMSLMHYTIQFHPQIVNDWRMVEKSKVRIGVGDTPVPGVQGT